MSTATSTVPRADERSHEPATSPTGRWAFMDRYVELWVQSLHYEDAPSSTDADPRFDTFLVPLLPSAATRKLLYATELVAYMLQLDPETWWYAKRRDSPWLEEYDPTKYDPIERVPTMTFALHQIPSTNNNQMDSFHRRHPMVLGWDTDDPEYAAYAAIKQRILNCEDAEGKLRGFKIPTRVQLKPPRPRSASELRSYLQEAITAVRFFKQMCTDDVTAPFRFDAVKLHVFVHYLGGVHGDLRELLSLGVPVTVVLRHNLRTMMEWPSFRHGNVFPAFAHDPAHEQGHGDGVLHTLDTKWISSSYELWSAVAYSSTLRNIRVQAHGYNNPAYDQHIARWVGYALAHSSSLRSLEIAGFRMAEDELDALERSLADPVPSKLRSPAATQLEGVGWGPIQFVRFKTDAIFECRPGGEINGYGDDDGGGKVPIFQTLEELNIPDHWLFPVVHISSMTQKIQVIVPGHGICEAPLTSVHSTQDMPPPSPLNKSQWRSKLTELVIHRHAKYQPGASGRLVRLVGRKLRTLRWNGGLAGAVDADEFGQDVQVIAQACPGLEVLAIETTSLESLAPLTSLPLCELSLVNTLVPMPALVAFLQLLGDTTMPISQSLTRFTYYCPRQELSIDAVDGAVRMLSTNDRLYSMTLGVVTAVNQERFKSVIPVQVAVERLPLANKLAFLSVVQHYHKHQPGNPLGKLDSGCIASVLQWFVWTAARRIRLLT